MNATTNVGALLYTPAVKPILERFGSRKSHARPEDWAIKTQIAPEQTAFIAARDSFYLASLSENGWPYTQYYRGPKGFLRTLDSRTIGLADFPANRLSTPTGNVLIFLMDYFSQRRVKVWAETEISEDPVMIKRLTDGRYGAAIDRAFLFRILAVDWNC